MFGKGKIESHSGERKCEKSIDFSAGCVKVESWLIRDQPSRRGQTPHFQKGDTIMKKKVYVVNGTWLGVASIDNIENRKSIFTIETEEAVYKANTLDEVMQLWRISTEDVTKVIDVERLW